MPSIFKNKSFLWSMFGIVVLVVGIIVALQLIPQEQDTRKDASVPDGPAQIKFNPTTATIAPDGTQEITVAVSTGTNKINGATAVIKYTYSGTTPPLTLSASDITIASDFTINEWSCPIKSIDTTTEANVISMTVSCLRVGTDDGFTSGAAFKDFFKFKIKAGTAASTGPHEFSFDAVRTKMSSGQGNDIVTTPTSKLNVTVTAAPAQEINTITVATPTVSCTSPDVTVTTTLKKGAAPLANTGLDFTYNQIRKTGTSNAEGVIVVTFPKAATTMNVIASGSGFTPPAVSTPVTLPTNCETAPPPVTPTPTPTPSTTDTDKRLLLNYDGLSCTTNTVNVTAEAKEDARVWQDVLITFKYDNQQKTATTNASGKASVSFPAAGSNVNVEATATDFDNGSIEVKKPTGCSASATTGAICNESCTASRTCKSGLTCLGGYCRDSRCSSDTSCGCSDVDVAAQQGTTQLPESGFDQTMTMSILGLLFLAGGGQLLWSYRQHSNTQSEEEES